MWWKNIRTWVRKRLKLPIFLTVSLCLYVPMLILELSLSGSLTASEQGSLMTTGELLNISTLDPLLPTFLITTLCFCVLLVITYYSLVISWEVFWASWRSPLLLDSSIEVVLTLYLLRHSEVKSEEICGNIQLILMIAKPLNTFLPEMMLSLYKIHTYVDQQ